MLNKIMLSEQLRNRRLADLYEEGILELGDEIPYKHSEESYLSPKGRNGYDDQSFSTKDVEMKWQAIGVEEISGEKCLKLIARKTIYEFFLRGAEGCVYGTEELNKISKLFATGRGALRGKSITMEDVNQLLDVVVDENTRMVYQVGRNVNTRNINQIDYFMEKYSLGYTGLREQYTPTSWEFLEPYYWTKGGKELPKYPKEEYTPKSFLTHEYAEGTEICTGYSYDKNDIIGKEKEKVILFFYNNPWRHNSGYWLASSAQELVKDIKDTRIELMAFGLRSIFGKFAGSQIGLLLSNGKQYTAMGPVRPIIYLKSKATLNTLLE